MSHLYSLPGWFFGFNILLEIIFLIVTSLVSLFAYKVYRVYEQKNLKRFSFAFVSLAFSYALLAIINFLFLSLIDNKIHALFLDQVLTIKSFLILCYAIFFIFGFSTLFYATFKTENRKAYVFLNLISLLGVYFSINKALFLYALSSLFLVFILHHYLVIYFDRKNKNELFVLLGIVFLLASQLGLAAQSIYFLPELYVISNTLELGGYSFIIISLFNVLKYGKKKKSS